MGMIQIKNLEYSYTGHFKAVFKNVHLQLDTDWKLGLVGRNGRGKTTLLKLLNGDISPDKGTIIKKIQTEIFPYRYTKNYTSTLEVVKDNIGPYFKLECQMDRLLVDGSDRACIEYSEVVAHYNDLDGYEIEAMIQREFNLMKLSTDLLDRSFETLSGGEKTKALIIALFLRKNHFLLLDEPTNHLDLEGKKTLAAYLSKKKGFIVVSHDRNFLDATVNHIVSINKGTIDVEKGTFSSWNKNRLMHESFEQRKKDRIEADIKQMEKAAKESRKFSHNKEADKSGAYDKGFVGARAARLMKRAKNIERRQKEQLNEKKLLLKNFEDIPKLVIKQEEARTKELIQLQSLTFGFGDKALLSDLSVTIEEGDCVWIRGVNGSGKSTLLNIIKGRLKGYSGIVKVQTYLKIAESYQEPFWTYGMLQDLIDDAGINRTIFQTTLAYFDMHEAYFERPIETFSQGELKKIDIARALSMENQLIILDEPLNYMDIFFREQLEKAILHYRPTIIFVEHDERFGKALATKVIAL